MRDGVNVKLDGMVGFPVYSQVFPLQIFSPLGSFWVEHNYRCICHILLLFQLDVIISFFVLNLKTVKLNIGFVLFASFENKGNEKNYCLWYSFAILCPFSI